MIQGNSNGIWIEQLNVKFNIKKLKQEVIESVFPLGNQVVQGKDYETPQYNGFGGWSILSRNADWTDGWEAIQLESGDKLENFLPTKELIYKAYKHFNIAHSLEYDKPTQCYVGEIKKVMDKLKDMGLEPRRARITCLKAGSKSLVHKDAETTEYMARLHIPLWTNEQCVHICQGTHLHLPADGHAHIMWVNRWHQIRNDSKKDRYHLIVDVYDTKKITQYFKYEGDFEQLKNFSKLMREEINSVDLTEEDVNFFEALKEKYLQKNIMLK
jgi:hypothetical protein